MPHWSRRFETPIHGLANLRDAANYVTKLPKAEQKQHHWQVAVEHLIYAAEKRSVAWMFFAEIAMLTALHHGRPEPVKEPRRKAVKAYRVVR